MGNSRHITCFNCLYRGRKSASIPGLRARHFTYPIPVILIHCSLFLCLRGRNGIQNLCHLISQLFCAFHHDDPSNTCLGSQTRLLPSVNILSCSREWKQQERGGLLEEDVFCALRDSIGLMTTCLQKRELEKRAIECLSMVTMVITVCLWEVNYFLGLFSWVLTWYSWSLGDLCMETYSSIIGSFVM